MNELSEIFAENLKYYRKKAELTQKKLSELLGYSEKAVSKWESGQTIPPVETLIILAKALNTSIDAMLLQSEEPKYFLGIDGGATKTMFALADNNGCVIKHVCLGPCNPIDIGMEKSKQIFADGIKAICGDIPLTSVSLFAGISGVSKGNNEQLLLTEYFNRMKFADVSVENDAANIISAGLGDGNGIAVIMGTGCIAFSKIGEELTQYGGYGYLFDNGGDGYNLGRDAIHAALFDEANCGAHTLITEILASKTGKSANEMYPTFYEKGKTYIASFSRVVFEAYDRGDTVAKKIVDENMAEIANLIRSAAADFSDMKSPIKVVFVGGLTSRSDVLFTHIRNHLKNNQHYHLSVYPFEPVLGALKSAGSPVDTQSDNNITR